MSAETTTVTPEATVCGQLLRKSLPMRVKLQEIVRALGSTEDLTCLYIGVDNGVVSSHLRRQGGRWHTVVDSDAAAEALLDVVGENVHVLKDGTALPFKKKTFDVVIVADFLEHIAADSAFIEECHKALKPDGRIMVDVTRLKRFSLIAPLRRLLGLTDERNGVVRPGYSEAHLFTVLRDGFDVLNVRTYSRFFVELIDSFVKATGRRAAAGGGRGAAEARLLKLYAFLGPLFWLAFQLDMLLFFSRGYHVIAVAKRRGWRPRNPPVLVDGRSISEAVLSKAAH